MTDTLVVADRIGIGYGTTKVLDELSLVIAPGTELALTGRSGSGKTTLLLVLAGLLAPRAGRVYWPTLPADPVHRSGEIGLVFQAPSLLPELTALENVTLPMRLRGRSETAAKDAARAALRALDLADAQAALPEQLSGGQQQRVAVARALAGRPRLMLADEPTGALDRVNAAAVLAVLRDHVRAEGGALVVATHDEELVSTLAERAALSDGQLTVTSRDGASR